ncbi:unnamed protein product [Coccothraustes coccothraustes]
MVRALKAIPARYARCRCCPGTEQGSAVPWPLTALRAMFPAPAPTCRQRPCPVPALPCATAARRVLPRTPRDIPHTPSRLTRHGRPPYTPVTSCTGPAQPELLRTPRTTPYTLGHPAHPEPPHTPWTTPIYPCDILHTLHRPRTPCTTPAHLRTA